MITVRDLSRDEIAAAAFLVQQHRERCGHEPWDRPGIEAHLIKIDANLPTALEAALTAAEDVSARTPAAIPWPRYRPPRAAQTAARDRGPVCGWCGQSETRCNSMQRKTGDDHDFRPVTR